MNSELNFKSLFITLKKRIIYIVLITLVCVGIAAAYTFTVTPVYSVTAEFYSVNVPPESNYPYTDSSLVSAQQKLVNDYIEIIKSDKMLVIVRDDLISKGYKDMSVGRLRSMISTAQIEETSIFTVSVSGVDKKEIKDIISSVYDNVGTVIDDTQQREHAVDELSEKSEIKPVKVSPSVTNNLLTGAAVGFFGSLILFMIISYYDRTVRSEEDLKNRFDLPIIGVIPKWEK